MPPTDTAISTFLQSELQRAGVEYFTAVEAAARLDKAGVLKDSKHRRGLPLRNLLREGRIRGARQQPNQPHGRWFIDRLH